MLLPYVNTHCCHFTGWRKSI